MQWILTQEALSLLPTHAQIKSFTQRIARANRDPQPIRKRWINTFLQRNPVQTKKNRLMDSNHVNGATIEII